MSIKLTKHLEKITKNQDYIEGGSYVRNIFDTALINIFGQTLGTRICDMLIKKGIAELNKKTVSKTIKKKKAIKRTK